MVWTDGRGMRSTGGACKYRTRRIPIFQLHDPFIYFIEPDQCMLFATEDSVGWQPNVGQSCREPPEQ